MSLDLEAVIRDFCDAWGNGVRDPDVDKIVSMFAEDGEWQLYVPGGPVIKGREALRAEIERQLTYVVLPECNILRISSGDGVVMTERLDWFTRDGSRKRHYLVAVYELDASGLITSWREYFDTLDLANQTGVDPARLSGLED